MKIYGTARAVGILFLILLSGCAMGNYGSLKTSRDVAVAFETYHVYSDHRYYYLNQQNNPFAVAAIQKPFSLTGPLWTEFDPTSAMFEKVVGLVKDFPVPYSYTRGAYIQGLQGEQIGYWYSSLRIVSVKVDDEAKTVSINTEQPWLDNNLP